jgi:hypothetical protein
MVTNENLAHQSSRRHPYPLWTGAASFKRVLGGGLMQLRRAPASGSVREFGSLPTPQCTCVNRSTTAARGSKVRGVLWGGRFVAPAVLVREKWRAVSR